MGLQKSQTQQLNNPKPPVLSSPAPSFLATTSLFSLWVCFYFMDERMKVTQLCPILCSPMDYTINVILQARILEWVAVSISSGSSQPRDWTQVTHIAGGFFTSWATRETFLFRRYVHLCYILDSTCNWYHMMFLFFFRTYFPWYGNLYIHPCCCIWHYFILFLGEYSGSWWWTGRPGVLQFMGRKESEMTEQLNWTE